MEGDRHVYKQARRHEALKTGFKPRRPADGDPSDDSRGSRNIIRSRGTRPIIALPNFSHFVARTMWRRRGVFPLCSRAHRPQRRELCNVFSCPWIPPETFYKLLEIERPRFRHDGL